MTIEQQWLSSSGESPEYLSQALDHGFTLHKLSHENPSPILIYRKDIPKLEEETAVARFTGDVQDFMEERINKSRACYELKSSGLTWSQVSEKLSTQNAIALARNWARTNNLPWPIK